LFYQPYIPPTIEELSIQENISLKIIAFNGLANANDVEILPSYNRRRVKEFISQKVNPQIKKLSFLEIKALKEKIDIIHIQHSFLFSKVTSILALPKGVRPKVIITLRGGDTYIKPWVKKNWKDFYSNYGKKVDAFVVMSENQKRYLTKWGVPLESIHVIPISFGKKFKIEPKYPNKDELKLVSIFRMCWEKNIADNLRFVKQIKEFGIKVQYDVYGDGSDLGQLYYLLDCYGLNENVNVKGKIENTLLKEKLKTYDFILQLSHSESFGMSLVEAQTFGVPAVVSNADGLSETVQHQYSGLVLERDFSMKEETKTLIDLWKNESLYFTMSANAIQFAQSSFNTKVEVDRLVNLYSKLVN
jgi:glycosyltransferase involved in cell wall biosynthesis